MAHTSFNDNNATPEDHFIHHGLKEIFKTVIYYNYFQFIFHQDLVDVLNTVIAYPDNEAVSVRLCLFNQINMSTTSIFH